MTTAVATIPQNLPAHLVAQASKFLALNEAATGGIKAGGAPMLSIKGSKFHIKDSNAEVPFQTIMMTLQGGVQVPAPFIDTVIVAANPKISKKFYAGKYSEDNEDQSPTCSSDDGERPDAHIATPVNAACATCPNARWGSRINEANGKEGKACADSKRLVVIPSADLNFKALGLDVTPAALKEYGQYINTLSARGIPVVGIVTRLKFDANAAFPKLQFEFVRFLDEAEFAAVQERMASDEVLAIVAPKRIPIQPVPAQGAPAPAAAAPLTMPDATTHSMAAATAAAAAAVVGHAPVTEVDKMAAAAAAVVIPPNNPGSAAPQPGGLVFGSTPATDAAGAAKRGRKKAETGPAVDAATAAAAAATVASLQPVSIDSIPEPFKAAIVAAGGLDTPMGKAIYDALPKPAAVPPAAVAVAPTPPASTPPAAGFSTAAPENVVAKGGDLAAQLGALLGKKS